MLNIFNKTKEEPKSVEEVLAHLKKIEEELSALKEKAPKNVQKVGMVRYNPFPEVGGDQSFCIALLDGNNDGFVLTSHYLRESNRVYAKPVKNGQSQYQLSDEEKKAIEEAININ